MRMFASTAILCTFLTSQALSNPLPKPQALPAPFLPTLPQLQKIPIHFQQSLLNLLNHKSNLLGHNNKNPTTVAYNGRPTTQRPNKRPRPSSELQHQQDLDLLFQYHPEEADGGGKPEKGGKKSEKASNKSLGRTPISFRPASVSADHLLRPRKQQHGRKQWQ